MEVAKKQRRSLELGFPGAWKRQNEATKHGNNGGRKDREWTTKTENWSAGGASTKHSLILKTKW